MRIILITACASLGCAASAAAFENAAPSAPSMRLEAPALQEAARPGRMIAAFAVEDRVVTLSAYGRRARARLNGDVEGLRHARAMGKVFDGAPQQALLTVELSVKF
ncbi:MAG: hypothetical protein ACK4NP_10935 [Parvularculaceae bacterium]